MENFKVKVRNRVMFMSLITILVSITYFVLLLNRESLPEASDFIRGFQMGIFCVLELVLVFLVFKNLGSMNNEKALKNLYIEENDERKIMIMQKTGAMGMAICNIGLAFATVVAGFFSETVFFSLLGATVFTALIKGFFKLYYHRKL